MDSTTKRILTSREDMAIVRLITFSIIITMACGINRSIFFVPSAQLTSECTIPSLEIGETYDIAAVDFEVHSKMCEVVSGARKVQLIVINILNESKIIMVGRKAKVTKEEAIHLIEKFIEHFTTNEFPAFGDQLWKEMSKQVGGRWGPRTVYNHVREDKRGDLTEARKNKKIVVCFSKPKHVLVDDISDGENENLGETDDDDDEWLPEVDIKNQNLERFYLLLRHDEWEKIRPTDEIKDRLKSRAWASVLTAAMKKQHNFECAFLAKASHVCTNFNPNKQKDFLKLHAYCADKRVCKNVLVGIADNPPTAEGLRLIIHTIDTRDNYHRPVTRPLNGAEREEVKAKLSVRKAANYRNHLLRDGMQYGESVPYNIRGNNIYRQVKMEGAREEMGKKRGETLSVIDSLRKMSTLPLYKGSIHDVGAIRFFVIYCNVEQILAYQEYIRLEKEKSEIAIDASGKMVKAFEICPGQKTGHIFLFTITIRYNKRTICTYQTLSEVHTQEWIEYWLKSFKRRGAEAPGRAVSDYERAIPMSSCLAFNNMSFKEYIDICFQWAISKEKKPLRPAKTIIRIDVAHIMHLAAGWKSVKNEKHKTVKQTRLYCVALMVDSQTVEQFSRIFILTNVISLHPFSDTIITLDGITMKVSDALHELEDAIGNREALIKNLEESMSSYEEKKQGETIAEFEEGENDTLTHRFIKSLISKAKPSPSDIEGTIVNGFYNEEFTKALERIAKEFPAWTGVAEPGSYDHASTAYQEGYFAQLRSEIQERVKLPCAVDRFVSEHLKSLKSGSNQFASDLRHANHQRGSHSPILNKESDEISSNDVPIPRSPLKKINLANDSDMRSYEPWGGFKNKGFFRIESGSSEDEESPGKENLKWQNSEVPNPLRKKVRVSDSHDSDFEFNNQRVGYVYDEYETGGPIMEEMTKSEESKDLHPPGNEVSGTSELGLQSLKSSNEKHVMDQQILDLTKKFHVDCHNYTDDTAIHEEGLDRTNTDDCMRHTAESPTNNCKNAIKFTSDKLRTSDIRFSNSPHSHSNFTSTPLADHSYAAQIKPDDHEVLGNLDISTDEAGKAQPDRPTDYKLEQNFTRQSSDHPVDKDGIITLSDENEGSPLHIVQSEKIIDAKTPKLLVQIQEYKRKMEQMNVKKPKQHKRFKSDEKTVSKQPGHYFQARKEIRILNKRLTSKKKGLVLTNANLYTKTLKVKPTDAFEWKYAPGILENKTLPKELKVCVKNTCGLDSILHVIQFCAIDNQNYESFLLESENETLRLLVNFMKEGMTQKIQLERLKLLNRVYPIEQPVLPLFPFFLNANDAVETIWRKFMEDVPSGFRNFKCSNPTCSELLTPVHLINVDENILRREGYQALEKALLYHKTLYNVSCKKAECRDKKISGEEQTTLNVLIGINLDVRDSKDRRKTMEGQLIDFPPFLQLERGYTLVGIIDHEPPCSTPGPRKCSSKSAEPDNVGHFTAYCRRDSGDWIHCDDMQDNIQYRIEPNRIVKPHLAIYVIDDSDDYV